MQRFFLLLMIAVLAHSDAAMAAYSSSSFGVSVTVVAPGTLTGKIPNANPGQPAGLSQRAAPAPTRSNNNEGYERFDSSQSPRDRGGLFP